MKKLLIPLLIIGAFLLFGRKSSAAESERPSGDGTRRTGEGGSGGTNAAGVLRRYGEIFRRYPGPFPPGALAIYAAGESGGNQRSVARGGIGFHEAGLFQLTVSEDGSDETTRADVDPLDPTGATFGVQTEGKRILQQLSAWFAEQGYSLPRSAADWLVFLRAHRSIGGPALKAVMKDAHGLAGSGLTPADSSAPRQYGSDTTQATDSRYTPASRSGSQAPGTYGGKVAGEDEVEDVEGDPPPNVNPIEALKAWLLSPRANIDLVETDVQPASKIKMRLERSLAFPQQAFDLEPYPDELQPLPPRGDDVPHRPANLWAKVDGALRAGRRTA